MGSPRVSIIVPLYNAHNHVANMVEAIQAQTLQDFEAIFVDGGPGNATAQAFEASAGDDQRFAYVFQENQGAGVARNAGIEQACGDYLAFFDADDMSHPHLLEHAVQRADETQADIVIYQSRQYDAATGEIHPSPDRWDASAYPAVFDPREHATWLFDDFRNWPWDKLFRRSWLNECQLRFPALLRIEDLAFTCTALAQARRIALLDEKLYTYTVNSDTSSTQTQDAAPVDFIESCRVLKNNLEACGVLDIYRTTYTRWASLACAINLLELHQADSFTAAYDALKDGGLTSLELDTSHRASVAALQQAQKEDAQLPQRSAGVITFDDANDILGIVENEPIEQGMFDILQRKHALTERRWQDELDDVRTSRTWRLGNMMLTPLKTVRDKLGRQG